MFTRHDGFLVMLLPKIEGRWAPVIAALRRSSASPRGDLQALVMAGATPGEITGLAKGYFHAATATFRGLGSGFTKIWEYRDDSPQMALWLMDCLADPWPVLEELGVDRGALVRYLFSACTAWEWARKADLVGMPEAFRAVIGPDGITWHGPAPFPPLPWFPNHLGAGLHLTDLEGPLPVPDDFRWAGTIHLRGCRNLGDVQLSGGGRIRIEDCPGLHSLQVKGEVEQVTITGCPDLKSIRLGMVGLPVPRGSRRPFIRFDRDVLEFGVPGPKVRESHHHEEAGVWLTDCPGLTQLRMGAGDLGLRGCHGLEVLHRPSAGNIQVEDCAGLAELRMGPGDLAVARCPGLTLIRREGTGEARVTDCTALTVIESQFSKHMDPWSAIWLKACPNLTEIRSHIGDLRHCGDIHLEDCANLRQLPYLRAQGALTILGSPQVERMGCEQRRGGWIIGAPATPEQLGGAPARLGPVEALPRITAPRSPVARPRRAAPPTEPLPPGMINACPTLSPSWERRLRNLRNMGLSLRDQIRGLEEAGAPAEVLQKVIIHLYRPEPAWPHGHGRPYMEAEATPEERLGLCSWAVEVLRRPEKVLGRFGHTLLDVFAYRVACLPRERWMLGSIGMAFEGHPAFDGATMLAAAIEEGLRFDYLFDKMDLTWIRKAIQGYLEIVDPVAPLRLPPSLSCLGRFEVRGAHGFTRLQGIRVLGDHSTAIIENCPDLEGVELPRANRVEVRNCGSLQRIWGCVPLGGLEVAGCPQLIEANLAFPKNTLARPGITFRTCPSLVRLESMSQTRRVIGDLTLTDCPSLMPPLPPLVVMGRLYILNAPFLTESSEKTP